MVFNKHFSGMVRVELISTEIASVLFTANARGVGLFHLIQTDDLTCQFWMYRSDYARLCQFCERRGETLRILQDKGCYGVHAYMASRPFFWIGLVLFLAGMFILPTRVLFVSVEGNRNIPANRILEAAENCGIRFGASRREVRSEQMKNALLVAVPELQWAGINTFGCSAVISVREGIAKAEKDQDNAVSSIVAARDGYILSGTVTQGTGLFQVGESVIEGQTLISGYMDCGFCIRAGRAEGEIIAQTRRSLSAVTPSKCVMRCDKQGVKRKVSVIFRKKRINLWKDSGISDSSCGRMYKEYYITLPGGFSLPIAFCVDTYVFYDSLQQKVPQEKANKILTSFVQNYLPAHMICGSVLEKKEDFYHTSGTYGLIGTYVCQEMIGREQRERIGDTNGKID